MIAASLLLDRWVKKFN